MTTLIRTPPPGEIKAIEPLPTRTDPDAELVEKLRSRRNEAAEVLVTRFGPRAYRLALRIVGDAPDAEEVTQDALWRVFNKIHTFRGDSVFGSWVYRITANAAYEKLRRRSHERHETSWEEFLPSFDELGQHAAPITDWSPRVEDPAVRGELRAELTRAIEHLPPELRTVFVMRDVDGISNAEVAVALEMSVPAVKARLHRARLFLRECLSRFWAMQTSAEAPPAHRCSLVKTTTPPEQVAPGARYGSLTTHGRPRERGAGVTPDAGIAPRRETMSRRTLAAHAATGAGDRDG